MGEPEDKRRKFVLSNLKVLTDSTVIGPGFFNSLITHSLINDAEKRVLLDSGATNATRAELIYTETINRWNPTQLQQFKKILEETGNITALQTFTKTGAESLLTKEQRELVKEHRENKLGDLPKVVTKKEEEKIPNQGQSQDSPVTPEKKTSKSIVMEHDMKLFELIKKTDVRNLSAFIDEIETARRLVKTFSREELFLLLTNEETRVTDIIGRNPQEVSVALGEEFIPQEVLAKFRTKFNFPRLPTFRLVPSEIGRDFCLKYLWGDLGKEMEVHNDEGPVRLALREVMEIMDSTSSGLLSKLEGIARGLKEEHPFHQRLPKVINNKADDNSVNRNVARYFQNCVEAGEEGLVEWVLDSGLLWKESGTLISFGMLPYFIHYSGNLQIVTRFLEENKGKGDLSVFDLLHVLRFLILSCSKSVDNEKRESSVFTQVKAFLHGIHTSQRLRLIFEVLVKASREEITLAIPSSYRFVCDVSIGTVFLKLAHLATSVDKNTWLWVVSDIIRVTPCCDLPGVLLQLKIRIPQEQLLRDILTSIEVFTWESKFSSYYRKRDCSYCGLNHLLSFYFSVFGLTVEWMGVGLASKLTVEVTKILEANLLLTHLLPRFHQIAKKALRDGKVNNVGKLANYYRYRTETEWKRLIEIIGEEEEFLQPGDYICQAIPSEVAGPFIRVLLNKFGKAWTGLRVTSVVWKKIPSKGSSIESLGSLLHSAIELGEEDEVNKRAWPGLLSWRNSQGKNALDFANEKLDKNHPVTLLLQELCLNTHA